MGWGQGRGVIGHPGWTVGEGFGPYRGNEKIGVEGLVVHGSGGLLLGGYHKGAGA